MEPVKVDVTAWEGSSKTIVWQHVDEFDNPISLEGFTAVLEIRETQDDETDPPKLRATTENGLLSIDAENGELILSLEEITLDYNGKYDYFLIDPDGKAWYPVQPSKFKVSSTVTHKE